jgi:hypothetical protein
MRLVAETLFLHVLQRGVQAFIVLITKGNKAEGISAGTDLRREKFHQAADRAGESIYLGFSDGGAPDAAGKLGQAAGKRNLLQHRGNLMAAEVEADGFVVGDPYSRRPRFGLRLGKVWHEEIIVFLCRTGKITEASGPNLCRCAPNRLSWLMN